MNKPTDHLPLREYTSGVKEVDAKTRYRIAGDSSDTRAVIIGLLSGAIVGVVIVILAFWLTHHA